MNEHSFIFASEMRVKDENKEIAIRQKAIEMIVEQGFDGLSMQKLAKAANVSPATIYLYFKNREDLLNQIFIEVEEIFAKETLRDFDPEMGFEEGLWKQWQNRYNHIINYPLHFKFMEQFRNSPLVNHKDINISVFKDAMGKFCMNAVTRGEIDALEPAIFWSVAYGPLYTLIQFHLSRKAMGGREFILTDAGMKQAFNYAVKALKK